ncbi:MAG: hypothetical protein HKN28_19640 [Alphaproteobacteria bacterium]|nr:hypothetical protein [Alphaproteobacteria bacterium]
MTSESTSLPTFTYFPDPVGNGCIVRKSAICHCCGEARNYMYTGPVHAIEEVEEVCPWCIADGSAAAKWSCSFSDMYNVPDGIPKDVADEIEKRTPGFATWQGNTWLYSETDAMVFVGEVHGERLVDEGNQDKIDACMKTLGGMTFDRMIEHLKDVVPGGEPAIYLFQDRASGTYEAYSDSG